MKFAPPVQLDEEFRTNGGATPAQRPRTCDDQGCQKNPSPGKPSRKPGILANIFGWLRRLLAPVRRRRARERRALVRLPDGLRVAATWKLLEQRGIVGSTGSAVKPSDVRWALLAAQRILYRARDWFYQPVTPAQRIRIRDRRRRVIPVTALAAAMLEARVRRLPAEEVIERLQAWVSGPEAPEMYALRRQAEDCLDDGAFRVLCEHREALAERLLQEILDLRPKSSSEEAKEGR